MNNLLPTFPPLLTGHCLDATKDPANWAQSGVRKGTLGAGDLVWSERTNRMRFALVLEPEVPRERCGEMLFVAMVAFGDAAGALIPPEVSVTYQWPSHILMNDGQIGSADMVVSDTETDGVPDWMIFSLDIQMMPDFADMNPGNTIEKTTMWDEGCGEITRTELLESVARHTVAVIHSWSEDGFQPIHKQWFGRICQKQRMAGVLLENGSGSLIGLDETGNALLSTDGETGCLIVFDALTTLRDRRLANA